MQYKHFIRQWREYRQFTQEQLGERVDRSHSAISRLERGVSKYDEGVLHALAEALNTSPADLIARNPFANDSEFAEEARKMSEEQRRRVATILRAFREQDEVA